MYKNESNMAQASEEIATYQEEVYRLEKVKEQVAAQRRLDMILDSLPHPFYVIDAHDYTVVVANQAALRGVKKGERHRCYELTHKRSSPCLSKDDPCPLEIVKRTKKPVTLEHTHYNGRGEPVFVEVHGFPIFDEQGEVAEMIEYSIDITKRKLAEQKLAYLATHDALTALPNRTLFDIRLRLEMGHAVRDSNRLAVMLLDLDGFKEINDTLGHEAGDEVLRAVGKRLDGLLRESDTVARLGGDEFLILVPALSSPEDAGTAAHKIIKALAAPLEVRGKSVETTASLGVAIFPDHGSEPELLIKYADIAMYEIKGQGGGGYRYYQVQHGATP